MLVSMAWRKHRGHIAGTTQICLAAYNDSDKFLGVATASTRASAAQDRMGGAEFALASRQIMGPVPERVPTRDRRPVLAAGVWQELLAAEVERSLAFGDRAALPRGRHRRIGHLDTGPERAGGDESDGAPPRREDRRHAIAVQRAPSR